MHVRRYDYLHHNHAGVVSLSGDASEVVVTLTKAIYLDSSYQVSCRPCFCDVVFSACSLSKVDVFHWCLRRGKMAVHAKERAFPVQWEGLRKIETTIKS